MCGFFLAVNDTGVDVNGLTESIRHRGPDSTKYFMGPRVRCGFNRLAIVDNDPRSDQPMVDPSGRYLLAFNGEIYNHNDLRSRLTERHHVEFVTHSDTEVLLKGLILEGEDFISKMDGIFAFAFVDLLSCDVLLARDVFGVKPLYFYSEGDRLYVSSEVRPLWRVAGKRLSILNIVSYLSYGTVAESGSIISNVNAIVPNSIKKFRSGNVVATTSIHDFEYDTRDNISVDELTAAINETIDSQQPAISYGVLFSGGLDSTVILDRCAEDSRFSGAYSVDVDHPDMSERQWQEYVISVLHLERKYRKVTVGREHLSLENIAGLSRGLDCPLFHPNFIGSLLLTRLASEDGLKVLISGEGADELFLGYRWFFSENLPSEFLEYVPFGDIQSVLQVAAANPIQTSSMTQLEMFQKIYLQRWLQRQDLTGMANSVEVRVPFLGLEFAKQINQLSMEFKRGNGEAKWLIKRMLSNKFSQEFRDRKKVGFDFPLNDWIGEEHIDFLRRGNELIDRATLNAILQKYEGSYMKNRFVFSLVSLSLWQQSLK